MTMNDLMAAFELIDRNPAQADFAGPQPSARVASAERALGLAFSPSYKEFLLRFGCGGFDAVEIYGVITDRFHQLGHPRCHLADTRYAADGRDAPCLHCGL